MSLALSGLASGFDWKSIVDQLIEVSRTPQRRMRSEKSQLASKTSALNEVKGLVTSLKSSLQGLGSEDSVQKRSATFANSTTSWSASASKDTPAGQYVFELTRKATAARIDGAQNVAAPGVPGGDPSTAALSSMNVGRAITAGTFTVNGNAVTIGSTANTLEDVLNAINAAAPGVTASYNAGTDRIELTGASPIVLGAANDTSNFLQAMKLSTGSNTGEVVSASSLGAISLSNPISSANFSGAPVVDGSLEINGVEISYTTGESVQSILNKINASSAGVNASYDYGAGRFVLTNKTTGDVGIFVANDTGGLASAMGLSARPLTAGMDAQFTINGGATLTSRSNVLDETAHGIKGLSITATSENDPQTVTVSGDTAAAKTALTDFISKYNAVQSAIERLTKVDVNGDKVNAAVLAGNRELAEISRNTRRFLYEDNTAITGSVKRLSDLGINFAGIENTISVTDSAKLDARLADSAEDVINYFTNSTGGLIARMDGYLDRLLSTTSASPGTFKTQTDSMDRQSKSLDKQIEAFERQLASQRALLETSFIAMEKAQSMYQQQGAYLSNAFKQK